MTPNEKIESRRLRVLANAWTRALKHADQTSEPCASLLVFTDQLRAEGARYSDLVHLAAAAKIGRADMDAALELADETASLLGDDYTPRAGLEVQR